MLKFMAKVFFKYNGQSDPVQISDWTLFELGTFVGSQNYVRPGQYNTQLYPIDWDINFDNCFPGKFFKIANEYTGNKTFASTFFLCFSDEFDSSKCLQCSVISISPPYYISLSSNFTFTNDVQGAWHSIYCNDYSSSADINTLTWVFSDVPYYNTIFSFFDEIAYYDRTNPYLNSNYSYCVYKRSVDDGYYYGFKQPMYFPSTSINPPNTLRNFSVQMLNLIENSPVQANTDPYVDGGGSSSGSQGGGGSWDDSSDIVQPIALNLPDSTAILKMYLVDQNTLASLGSSICSQSYTNWQSYLPMFSNPLEALITLHWLPVVFPDPTSTGNIVIGRFDTQITSNVIHNQFFEFDCGSITVPEYWGNYLDYDSTRIQLYLPYISCINLSPDEVMKKELHVVYRIDALTGSCTAIVYTYNNTIIYTGSGNMAVELPLSSTTFSGIASNLVTAALAVATVPYSATAGSLATVALAGANSVMNSKPNFSKAGYIGGTAGAMSYQTPYLLISRVAQCVPQNNNEFSGYPLYVTKKLSDCSGFTQIENIHLSNMTATDAEKQQITNLLKEGVII